jgi:hypothetical protein
MIKCSISYLTDLCLVPLMLRSGCVCEFVRLALPITDDVSIEFGLELSRLDQRLTCTVGV